MTPRWATTAVFVVNGAAIGTWVAQIPWIQERFDLSKSAMGLLITGMAIAVILAFPIAGQAIVRHGSERIVWVGGIAASLAIMLPVFAPAPLFVALGLFVLGGASATQDVSMNSHGVKVEKDLGKPIMSSLHAGWAFGGMLGAGFAALTHAVDLDPRIAVPIASAILLVTLVASARRIGGGSAAAGDDTPNFALPSRGVVLLAIICLLVMVTEGAMADWGGLYLRQDLGASAALAALAYSFFTAGMFVGRVAGDWINRRIGAVALLRWGALLTGLPLGAMLLIGAPAAALAGLFLVGLGVANGVPLMFSAAGRQPDTPPGPGIAAVSSMGSLGFLAGPPVIGVIADASSLPWALSLLILGAIVVFALASRATGAHRARRRPSRPPAPASRWRCHELRRGDLRPRRRPRRLDRAVRRAWAALGRAPRRRRRGAPGGQPRPPRPREWSRSTCRPTASTRRPRACSRPRPRTRTASSPTRAPPTCSRCRSWRSRPRARCRSPARGSRAAGLRCPDVLVTSDQVARGKPAPDPYLLAAERLGVDPAACLVVEDAPAGIAAGRAAGMTVWAVATTHAPASWPRPPGGRGAARAARRPPPRRAA